jgi:glycosyltransferase involved in cell wall biosynthesis
MYQYTLPKLSIITVNLNNAQGLQKTIESVETYFYQKVLHRD